MSDGNLEPHARADAGALLARLRADLVLRGHELVQLPGGAFIVSRWQLSHYCADLEDLRAFAQRLGVES
ncbi:hypothetical protein QTI24_06610 [Variovorax sp. J22P240]|uniref:hypothetical protein n=1 Tax=Variovorax sp. J22P240 TaxID=3053514 RepID=UPI0025758CD3|nr:hypothetical protein [Variovorax sp. J22P240]MDL9998267.1 hypothetical protein [Variovorax sp. J22P240]